MKEGKVTDKIVYLTATQEEGVKIHKKEEPKPESLFKVGGAGDLLRGTGENVVKLPQSLSMSAKLRKAFRYRRFGEALVPGTYKREQLPLPEVKEEDKKQIRANRLKKPFV